MFTRQSVGVLLALLLFGTMASAVAAYQSPSPTPQDSPPAGQVVRKGLSGTVVGVSATSIVVQTKYGNVTVEVDGQTVVDAPPDRNVGIGAIEGGMNVAISLNRSMVLGTEPVEGAAAPGPTETPGTIETPVAIVVGTPAATGTPPTVTPTPEPSFRTATARRIVAIPVKASRSHKRGVVESATTEQGQGKGRLKLLNEDGSVTELELAEGTEGLEDGSDIILISRGKGGRPATDDTEMEISGLQKSEKITEWLERIKEKLGERDATRIAKLDELTEKRKVREESRLERTVSNAPQEARQKGEEEGARGRGQGSGGSSSSSGPGGQDASGASADKGKKPAEEEEEEDEEEEKEKKNASGGNSGGKGKGNQ